MGNSESGMPRIGSILPAELEGIDLYNILGVDRKATLSDIRKAYHFKARLLHPDKNRDVSDEDLDRIEEEMGYLNLIYGILSDPDKRKMYDNEYSKDHAELQGPYKKARELDQLLRTGKIDQETYNKEWHDHVGNTEFETSIEHREEIDPRNTNSSYTPKKPRKEYDAQDRRVVNDNSFNRAFEDNRPEDPNEFGYGDYQRTKSTAYSTDDVPKPPQLFKMDKSGKFNLNNFNQLFEEQIEDKYAKDAEEYQMVKLSLPGLDTQSSLASTSIASYNGLMIVGDDYETHGFQSDTTFTKGGQTFGYSDYQRSFSGHQNPVKLNLRKKESQWEKERASQMGAISSSEFKQRQKELEAIRNEPIGTQETEAEYYGRRARELEEESKSNARFVSMFESQFPKHIIEQAKLKQLEMSDHRPDSWM